MSLDSPIILKSGIAAKDRKERKEYTEEVNIRRLRRFGFEAGRRLDPKSRRGGKGSPISEVGYKGRF